MRLRLPTPMHGWRAFAGEVGIIVIGVLIALGAGQLVESIHWRGEVRNARKSLAEDMAQSNRAFAFRVATHDCDETHSNLTWSEADAPVADVNEAVTTVTSAMFGCR